MSVEETHKLKFLFKLCEEFVCKLCSAKSSIKSFEQKFAAKNKFSWKNAVFYVCVGAAIPLAIALLNSFLALFVVAVIVGLTAAMVEDCVTERNSADYDKSLSNFVEAMREWRAHYKSFSGKLEVLEEVELKKRVNDILGPRLKDDIEMNLKNIEGVSKNFEMVEKLLRKVLTQIEDTLEDTGFHQQTWDMNMNVSETQANLKARTSSSFLFSQLINPKLCQQQCDGSLEKDSVLRGRFEPREMPTATSTLTEINPKLMVYFKLPMEGLTRDTSYRIQENEQPSYRCLSSKPILLSRELGSQLDLLKAVLLQEKFQTTRLRIFIICHGFMNNIDSEWMERMTSAILGKEKSGIVMKLGWGEGCCDGVLQYNLAAANTQIVGRRLGKLVMEIRDILLLEYETYIWIIGHSLGCHIAGKAGRDLAVSGQRVDRITGLDPAGFGFENFPKYMLKKGDAKFVDVIHTDGVDIRRGKVFCDSMPISKLETDFNMVGYFGTMIPCGHLDFYPDGGHNQKQKRCNQFSHSEAIELFIRSILGREIFRTNQKFSCSPKKGQMPSKLMDACTELVEMGFHCEHTADGQFYLKVHGVSLKDHRSYPNVVKKKTMTTDGESKSWESVDTYHPEKQLFSFVEKKYPQGPDLKRLVVLINIEKYDRNDWDRRGSDNDMRALLQLFLNDLVGHCKVIVLDNRVTLKDVEGTIDTAKLWMEVNSGQVESLFFIIMCHGGKDAVFMSDGGTMNIREDIMQPFDRDSCPRLCGVPKLFFFICCRGKSQDLLRDVKVDWGNYATDSFSEPNQLTSLPSLSDTLVVFPSYVDHVSYRNTTKGTWFIQEFITTMKMAKNVEQTEIMTILNEVSSRAKYEKHPYGNGIAKQLPSIENNGFTSKFYFMRPYPTS